MGYWASFYSVNLEDIKKVFGSNNAELLKEIERANQDEFASSDEFFSDEIEEGAPTLKKALRDFFSGNVSGEYAWQNWYACQLVCRHMGEMHEGEDVGFISKLKFKTPLAKPRLFLPLGTPDDFPEVSHLELKEIGDHLVRARDHKPGFLRKFDPVQWEAFCRHLTTARDRQRDLVTFTH
jgi:hypothetical protein